ncbi:hypothetical protein EMPG_09640 [Blastomyces silverae]|uniref:Uncharacterized protein n=1 Tax=Blastomyces silverae TaxID=2060906 RepID=A0A0H1BJL1_9EURO|nr:hypothetical protein EMPG_09640 [Blastomyces silverae]
MRKRKKQQKKQQQQQTEREGQSEEGAAAEEMDVPIMFSPVGMGRSQVLKVLWEEERRKDQLKNFRAYGAAGAVDDGGGGGGWKSKSHFQRASSRTRDLLWCRQDHVKRFLRTSVFSWR